MPLPAERCVQPATRAVPAHPTQPMLLQELLSRWRKIDRNLHALLRRSDSQRLFCYFHLLDLHRPIVRLVRVAPCFRGLILERATETFETAPMMTRAWRRGGPACEEGRCGSHCGRSAVAAAVFAAVARKGSAGVRASAVASLAVVHCRLRSTVWQTQEG